MNGKSQTAVLVAMSGGVDSSAAAAMLLSDGYDVRGVTFVMDGGGDGSVRDMASVRDAISVRDAADVCRSLHIPHHVADVSGEFAERVKKPFAEAYLAGLTPNPCVECNRYVKFPALLREADKLGCEFAATGHYARIIRGGDGVYLARAADTRKDQSYALYGLDRGLLPRLLFPLGSVTCKAETRELAAKSGLSVAERPDSQDICFLPDGDYASWITGEYGAAVGEGDYVDASGAAIGRHRGHIAYTIGQRKGLGVAFGSPVYVLAKDAVKNTVTLGGEEGLFTSEITARGVNLLAPEYFGGSSVSCEAKTRYSAKPVPARASLSDGILRVTFATPVRAATPGQSVVLYDGEMVLGGGIII